MEDPPQRLAQEQYRMHDVQFLLPSSSLYRFVLLCNLFHLLPAPNKCSRKTDLPDLGMKTYKHELNKLFFINFHRLSVENSLMCLVFHDLLIII